MDGTGGRGEVGGYVYLPDTHNGGGGGAKGQRGGLVQVAIADSEEELSHGLRHCVGVFYRRFTPLLSFRTAATDLQHLLETIHPLRFQIVPVRHIVHPNIHVSFYVQPVPLGQSVDIKSGLLGRGNG